MAAGTGSANLQFRDTRFRTAREWAYIIWVQAPGWDALESQCTSLPYLVRDWTATASPLQRELAAREYIAQAERPHILALQFILWRAHVVEQIGWVADLWNEVAHVWLPEACLAWTRALVASRAPARAVSAALRLLRCMARANGEDRWDAWAVLSTRALATSRLESGRDLPPAGDFRRLLEALCCGDGTEEAGAEWPELPLPSVRLLTWRLSWLLARMPSTPHDPRANLQAWRRLLKGEATRENEGEGVAAAAAVSLDLEAWCRLLPECMGGREVRLGWHRRDLLLEHVAHGLSANRELLALCSSRRTLPPLPVFLSWELTDADGGAAGAACAHSFLTAYAWLECGRDVELLLAALGAFCAVTGLALPPHLLDALPGCVALSRPARAPGAWLARCLDALPHDACLPRSASDALAGFLEAAAALALLPSSLARAPHLPAIRQALSARPYLTAHTRLQSIWADLGTADSAGPSQITNKLPADHGEDRVLLWVTQ